MPSLHHRDQWQRYARYQKYPHGFLREVMDSTHGSTKAQSNDQSTECQTESTESTELLNEIETTDAAIGDITAETMLTTIGKIPKEMYYLEDTIVPQTKTDSHGHSPVPTSTSNNTSIRNTESTKSNMLSTTVSSNQPSTILTTLPTTMLTSETSVSASTTTAAIAATSGFAAHSTLFLGLALALLLLLVLCCVIACIISRVRKGYESSNESEMECDKNCPGVNQPLLSAPKESSSLSKNGRYFSKK